jgi:glycosyltransferase involved in cell wall biosynthesis
MKLLIIGRFAWNADTIRLAFEQHPYKDDVVHYDYMQVDELRQVIGAAYALTFVSLFEGFGIPILEAMKCGVPGIVSNTSSMPEVAGDAAILVDPLDEADIARAMSLMYKDENLRNQLAEAAIRQATKFSWDGSALAFYQIIEKISRKKP